MSIPREQVLEIGRMADGVIQLVQSQKTMIESLEAQATAQHQEILSLRERLRELESQVGSQMYQRREPLDDLVKSVERMRDLLSKKLAEKGANRPVKVIVTEMSALPVPSASFAHELVEGGSSVDTALPRGPIIEEIV
jgi:hypothetical protein